MHFLALADNLSKSVELAAQTLSGVSLLLLLFMSLRSSLKTVHHGSYMQILKTLLALQIRKKTQDVERRIEMITCYNIVAL